MALWAGAFVCFLPLFASFALTPHTAFLEQLLWFLGFLFLPSFLIHAFVLGSTTGYLLVCSTIALGLMSGLLRHDLRWFTKTFMLTVFAILLWYMVAPYTTIVQPSKNHQMTIVTQPPFLLRGLKRTQAMAEVKPCRYQILGWVQRQLYYKATCDTEVTTWQFDVDSSVEPILVQAELPSALYAKELTRAETLKLFSIGNVYPPEAAEAARNVFVQSPGLISPDGNTVAIVSNNLYSAEDVLVIH